MGPIRQTSLIRTHYHYSCDVMTKKGQNRRDQYIRAAIDFVDVRGIAGLTMRALGEELGVDPSAVYKYFPSKEALLDALLNEIIRPVAELEFREKLPRNNVIEICQALRNSFREHPSLAGIFASAVGNFPNGLMLTRHIIGQLQVMGLRGENLVRMYQSLEGYTLGASVFDSGGDPDTWTIRQIRYQFFEIPEFTDAGVSPDEVKRITDEAFLGTLNLLLDQCEKLATKS